MRTKSVNVPFVPVWDDTCTLLHRRLPADVPHRLHIRHCIRSVYTLCLGVLVLPSRPPLLPPVWEHEALTWL
jgi:hypothetical protein